MYAYLQPSNRAIGLASRNPRHRMSLHKFEFDDPGLNGGWLWVGR